MARMTFKLGEEYGEKLLRVAARSGAIAQKAIEAGSGIVCTEIRKNLTANLNDPASVSKKGNMRGKNFYIKTSGSLLESLGISKVEMDKRGFWNAKIGFGDPDYDPKGVANQLKARVMESGSSTIRKRPFVRPAVAEKRNAVLVAMQKVIDEETEKIMK